MKFTKENVIEYLKNKSKFFKSLGLDGYIEWGKTKNKCTDKEKVNKLERNSLTYYCVGIHIREMIKDIEKMEE